MSYSNSFSSKSEGEEDQFNTTFTAKKDQEGQDDDDPQPDNTHDDEGSRVEKLASIAEEGVQLKQHQSATKLAREEEPPVATTNQCAVMKKDTEYDEFEKPPDRYNENGNTPPTANLQLVLDPLRRNGSSPNRSLDGKGSSKDNNNSSGRRSPHEDDVAPVERAPTTAAEPSVPQHTDDNQRSRSSSSSRSKNSDEQSAPSPVVLRDEQETIVVTSPTKNKEIAPEDSPMAVTSPTKKKEIVQEAESPNGKQSSTTTSTCDDAVVNVGRSKQRNGVEKKMDKKSSSKVAMVRNLRGDHSNPTSSKTVEKKTAAATISSNLNNTTKRPQQIIPSKNNNRKPLPVKPMDRKEGKLGVQEEHPVTVTELATSSTKPTTDTAHPLATSSTKPATDPSNKDPKLPPLAERSKELPGLYSKPSRAPRLLAPLQTALTSDHAKRPHHHVPPTASRVPAEEADGDHPRALEDGVGDSKEDTKGSAPEHSVGFSRERTKDEVLAALRKQIEDQKRVPRFSKKKHPAEPPRIAEIADITETTAVLYLTNVSEEGARIYVSSNQGESYTMICHAFVSAVVIVNLHPGMTYYTLCASSIDQGKKRSIVHFSTRQPGETQRNAPPLAQPGGQKATDFQAALEKHAKEKKVKKALSPYK